MRPEAVPIAEDHELVARATRILLERTARAVGGDFFRAMARGIAETLGTRYGFVGELLSDDPPTIRTLAVWDGEKFGDNFLYPLEGTPCANVMAGELCHYPNEVAKRFPDDALLVEMGVESYLGLPISVGQKSAGLVVALHDQSTAPVPELARVLELFADRAATELERMRFEAALAASEARYRQIVTSCLEGVWIIDAVGNTTFVNRQMARMLGYTEEQMLGRSVFDFMRTSERQLTEQLLARRASGVAEQHEFRFTHKDGRDVWANVSAKPVVSERGDYGGAMAVVTDMTERRGLEAAAQQTQRLESLGVLAGGVAHDFNNLLVGILGNSEIALRDDAPPRVVLQDIRTAALRAAELTRQLLTFAGETSLAMAPVDLDATIADMTRLLSTAISKKTELRFERSTESTWVVADAGQLSQIVMNLVTNASEALADDPGTVTIKTAVVDADRDFLRSVFHDDTVAPGAYVSLVVTDTGCGMTEETLAKIFDPFFTTKFTGRGLGLAALRGAVRSHGGAIAVTSDVDVGTTFTILLPRAAAPTAVDVAARAAPTPAPSQQQVVLVVDDEVLIRGVMERHLTAQGCRVILAVDGLDALAKFRASADEIDLVLLDLTMPGLSGVQVFQEMVAQRPDVKVLITSGYSEAHVSDRLGGRHAGFLAKPWTANELLGAVRHALARTLPRA